MDVEILVLDRKFKDIFIIVRGRFFSDWSISYKEVWGEGSFWGYFEEEGIEIGRILENRVKFLKKKVKYGYFVE